MEVRYGIAYLTSYGAVDQLLDDEFGIPYETPDLETAKRRAHSLANLRGEDLQRLMHGSPDATIVKVYVRETKTIETVETGYFRS